MIHEEINALVSLAKAPKVPAFVVSNAVNRVNSILKDSMTTLDHEDRRQLVEELAEAMDRRRADCNATDLSRLAWLYLSLHEREKAKDVVSAGLNLDPSNVHCQNLSERLENQE
ncbi:MAG: hypothetical protein JW818_20975 [Pirellulales bacterium]|nr:hypothetical protein [Pirellulales bacterium]